MLNTSCRSAHRETSRWLPPCRPCRPLHSGSRRGLWLQLWRLPEAAVRRKQRRRLHRRVSAARAVGWLLQRPGMRLPTKARTCRSCRSRVPWPPPQGCTTPASTPQLPGLFLVLLRLLPQVSVPRAEPAERKCARWHALRQHGCCALAQRGVRCCCSLPPQCIVQRRSGADGQLPARRRVGCGDQCHGRDWRALGVQDAAGGPRATALAAAPAAPAPAAARSWHVGKRGGGPRPAVAWPAAAGEAGGRRVASCACCC